MMVFEVGAPGEANRRRRGHVDEALTEQLDRIQVEFLSHCSHPPSHPCHPEKPGCQLSSNTTLSHTDFGLCH